jgi:eukaryotic-like serine/threonine-protein kinase
MPRSGDSFWHSAKRWARSLTQPEQRAFDEDVPDIPIPSEDEEDVDDDRDAPAQPAWSSGGLLPAGAGIGGYRIERPLGQGSMGTLYLAVDPITDAPLAIKVVPLAPDEYTPNEARRRFLQEAQAACRLRHPDIVTVHGAGEERGLGFIVMELLSGSDLSRYTRPARLLPEPVVLRIVTRVAEALAYAHGQGVVHRDIKPANVMVHLPTHQVKLTDFGVAQLADASRTRSGFVLGSPAFMAPEQLAGARVDGRSDVYSLGVLLFQLLTGRLPHEGDSMGEVLRRIATDPAPDLRSLRPDLPQALSEAVALALEKRPEARYADARQLADDLRLIEPALGGSVP